MLHININLVASSNGRPGTSDVTRYE